MWVRHDQWSLLRYSVDGTCVRPHVAPIASTLGSTYCRHMEMAALCMWVVLVCSWWIATVLRWPSPVGRGGVITSAGSGSKDVNVFRSDAHLMYNERRAFHR